MSAVQLVQELERLGVRLWEDDGQLRFRAPQGVMTADRRDLLRREKASILQHLRDAAAPIVATADPASRHEPFPLTDLQSAYVIGRKPSIAYGGVACHAYGEIAFADLDPDRLQRAWNRLVARHDMLRAIVESDGFQRVLPEAPLYQVGVADLRGADAATVAARIDQVRADLDHKVHPLGAWPMFDLMVTRADARSLLHLSIDFLIADYVSVQVILDDLRTLYRDPEAALPPIDITFRDYLRAERRLKSSSRYDRDRAYWWSRIDALPPRPELPSLPPADGSAPVRFRRLGTALTSAACGALQRRAQAHEVTASGALLAAYADTVARWSRHPRFSLNVTVLQRLPVHPHVNHLIGDFTAVNLLAIDADPRAPFRERARTIQAQLWEDLDHALCSGVEVMREMTRRRGAGSALMPIVYTSALGVGTAGASQPALATGGELVHGISQTPQVWIDCQVMRRGDALSINWDVREGVFPPGLADDMFAAYVSLVEALAADDAEWEAPSQVALPPAQADRRRQVNATAAPLPDGLLQDGFLSQAGRTPERVALSAGGQSLTYADLLQRARSVADRLAGAGCGAKDLVAVWAPKGVEQIVSVLGTLLAGGAYLPIDVDQPPARRRQMLAMAGVRHVLTTTALATTEDPADGIAFIPVDAIQPAAADIPLTPRTASPDDVAYVIYTSGSTGVPKGVMIAHRAALNTIHDVNDRFGVGGADRILGLAQLGFDLSVYDIFGPLAVGATLVLPDADERSNPAHWAQTVATHGVTIWNSVPAQLQMLHEYLASEPLSLPSLRLAMLSGDWIPTALADQIRAQIPSLSLCSLGGATEASIWSIAYPIDRVAPEWKSIPYGRPLVNQAFHVLDSALRDCPDWVAGELYIGGAGLALGYFGDPQKTAERFITRPATGERLYRTGDLGRYLPDGNIEFLGREDSQVKIRGHRIELAEVETALQAHPGAARAAVVVHGDRPLDRKLAGFVEPARRRDEEGEPAAQLGEAVASRVGELDAAASHDVVRFSRQLDRTALTAMMQALLEQGLFATTGARHSLDEILAAARVAPRHHRLVRRWLNALERHQLVERDPASRRYRRLADVSPDALDEAWREVERRQTPFDRRTELIEYFRLTSRHLPELLRGELDPVQLLFPQGHVEIHEVAYTDNFLSRYHNKLVTLAVSEIADRHRLPCPFRVLEAGAGVGGTSIELIPSLADRAATYLFTDVSPFFLNNARERYRDFPWVSFGLFDINRDYRAQGLAPNSFDVIVCANVLHYARNAATVLARFSELLRPDGWLVFIDMMRDSYQVLTSMEFLFDATAGDFEDVRANRDETFISQPQWEQLLRDAGAEIAMCLPAADDVLAEVGFRVFAARFKHARVPLSAAAVEQHLAERLPDYMIPQHVQIVDALPTTDNGKIDRATLRSWIPAVASESTSIAVEEPANDLERRLAAVWGSVLRLERVGRNQDFFELGGDSLVAAQLVGRMREDMPEAATVFFDTLLRLVLDGPTIAKLAAHLTSAGTEAPADGSAAAARSPLVHLPGAKEGPLRVLVHDASGTLASYAGLLDDLGRAGRLSGFVVSDAAFVGTQAAVAVRRAASAYARALADTPRDGLHLIGHDVGGILAVEIARHLVEARIDVDSVTVINALPVPYLIDDELLVEYLFVSQAGIDPVRLGYPPESALAHAIDVILAASADRIPAGRLSSLGGDAELDAVAWCVRRLAARAVDDRMAAIGRAVAQSAAAAAPAGQVQALYDVFRHSLRAFALHQTAPYAGDIVVVRATEPTPLTRRHVDGVADYWRDVCLGDVRVIDVAAPVYGCLRPPAAAAVAGAITTGAVVAAAVR